MPLSVIEIKALGQVYLGCLSQPGGKSFDDCLAEGERLLHGLNDQDARAVLQAAAQIDD